MSQPAEVYRLVTDPHVFCASCHEPVHCRRVDGRNLPCMCFAGTETRCTGGDPCACVRDADALQAALEMSDAEVMAQRRAAALARQAEQWRPTLVAWVLFALTALLILGALATLGTGR